MEDILNSVNQLNEEGDIVYSQRSRMSVGMKTNIIRATPPSTAKKIGPKSDSISKQRELYSILSPKLQVNKDIQLENEKITTSDFDSPANISYNQLSENKSKLPSKFIDNSNQSPSEDDEVVNNDKPKILRRKKEISVSSPESSVTSQSFESSILSASYNTSFGNSLSQSLVKQKESHLSANSVASASTNLSVKEKDLYTLSSASSKSKKNEVLELNNDYILQIEKNLLNLL